jgi:hypothetical protein
VAASAPSDPDTADLTAAIEASLPPASEAHGGLARKDETLAREARAVTLRLGGVTWQQVADQVGYASAEMAMRTVNRALGRHAAQQVDTLRAVENARLDRAQAAIWMKVQAGDHAAIHAFLRISARRSKMNGLDAPTQVNVSASTIADMDAALAALETIVLGEDGREVSSDVEDDAALTRLSEAS